MLDPRLALGARLGVHYRGLLRVKAQRNRPFSILLRGSVRDRAQEGETAVELSKMRTETWLTTKKSVRF
jgi:hypothetical protein